MSYFERTTLKDELGANIGSSNPLPIKVYGGVTLFNTGFGVSISNLSTGIGASITNWSGLSGQYLNATIVGGSISVEMTAEITGASLNATVTNWIGMLGTTILVGNLARTVTPGGSWNVGLNGGLSLTNSSFGASITNFPASYPITAGSSINVGILGGSIANGGFGASVSNFPTGFNSSPGASWSVGLYGGISINNKGFGVSIMNLSIPITAGESISVGLYGGLSITNSGFGATITNWGGISGAIINVTGSSINANIAGLSILNSSFGVSITNWSGISGQYINANIVGGSISVEMTAEITGASLNATVTNWIGMLGTTVLVGNVARTVTPGGSWNVGLNGGLSLTNTSFGATVTNWPTVQIVGITNTITATTTPGASMTFNITGGSIANGGFGATISNWGGISGAIINVTGSSINANIAGLSILNSSFGVSITNWNGMSGMAVTTTVAGNSIYNSGFGATITNWGGISGAIINVTGSSINANIAGLSILNSGFGASVSNFPTGLGSSVTNFPASFGASVSNFPTGFGASITNIVSVGGSVFIGSSVWVRATDLDIRDLVATTDKVGVTGFVSAIQSGTWVTGTTGFTSVTNIVGVSFNQVSVGITNIPSVRYSMDTLQNGTASLTPQYKYFDVGLSTANEVVAGLSGFRVLVLNYAFTVGVSCRVQWKDGVTNLTGLMPFGSPGGIASPFSPYGMFRTGVSCSLRLGMDVGSTVCGHLTYVNI